MPTKTLAQYEKEFLVQMLGVSALPNDTMTDLRYKFYKGVVEGTLVIGGGGGGSATAEYGIPRIGDFFTAPDIKSFNANSNQTRQNGSGPALGIPIPAAMSVDAVQIEVGTAEAASTIRVGIYGTDAFGMWNTLLGSCVISGAATGKITGTFGAPIVLTAGKVWAVARVSSLTTLRLTGCVPASHSYMFPGGSMASSDTFWLGSDFGTSAALAAGPGLAITAQLPDHTALVALRRSA